MFKWSPNFDPNAETSIAPIWVLLPELKYHLFKWDYLKQILAQVGNPLKEDVATVIRSRPNLTKVRVEVDLLKPLPQSVWVGHEKQRGSLKGHEQILTYEGVPSFCRTCNLQGHNITNCNVEAKKGNRTKEEGPQTDEGKTGQIVVQNHKETAQGHNKEINRNKASTSQNVQYMDEEGFTKVTRNKNKTKTASSTNNTGNSNVDKDKGKVGKASKAPLNGGSSMNTEDKIVEEGGSKQPEVENDQDQPEKIKSVQALQGNIEKVPIHPKKIKSSKSKKQQQYTTTPFLKVKNMMWRKLKTKNILEGKFIDNKAIKKPHAIADPNNRDGKQMIITSQSGKQNSEDNDNPSNSSDQIVYPMTADTTSIQAKGLKLVIDLGTLQKVCVDKKEIQEPYSPDNENDEYFHDTSEEHVDNTSSDEDVVESFLETVEEDDVEVADSLIDAFAPFPKEPDPMIQEQEEVIQKQGLSPQGQNQKTRKNGKKG
ncbi:hypothetical protein KY285_026839 [Solanum tuberosum]|nr:hypothetical protein KY289_027040 [Solanum tuberosum]KAH0661926.1 hypothetical protein KY284_026857 [Solanum tuberosum]KAH0665633.1 hypothetical protein KY285_026839 [Solanum tuberosum]